MIVATAHKIARFAGSSTKRRNARMPANEHSRTAVEVRRGSQSHHTPHVGLAQIAPWQQSRNPRSAPTSSPASMRASHLKSLVNRYATETPNVNSTASIQFQAVGTWTYMIRCTLPMKCSGGATKRPRYEPTSRKSTPSVISACGSRGNLGFEAIDDD